MFHANKCMELKNFFMNIEIFHSWDQKKKSKISSTKTVCHNQYPAKLNLFELLDQMEKHTFCTQVWRNQSANSGFSKSLVFYTATLTPSANPRFLDTCNRNVERKMNASVYQDVWLHFDNSLLISNTLFWMTD